MRYRHILRFVQETPWAILPAKLDEIMAFLAVKAAGGEIDPAEVAAVTAAARQPIGRVQGNVAVLPLYGTIVQRMDLFTAASGGTSTEAFGAAFRQALADPSVGAVVIDVDSPGGAVGGVPELADAIHQARGDKPIVAVADTLMASAAYWIGSAADEIVASPSAEVGSVGVIAAHVDYSQALAAEGVAVSLITAGRYKAEGNPYAPLDDEARAHIQSLVDDAYGQFVGAVARGRGVSAATVRSDYGEGRVLSAKAALAAGMVDRVETLDQTIDRLTGKGGRRRGARAETARARWALAAS